MTTNHRCFILSLVLICFLILSGCDTHTPISTFSIDSYDEETKIEIDTDNSQTEDNTSNEEHGYSIKAKTYLYNDSKMVILDVTNNTNANHTIKITGKYYDRSNTLIKTETKEFEGFYSGYQNYFLFKPDINFEKFDYSIEVESYDAACYASSIKLSVPKIEKTRSCITELQIQGDFQKYPTLVVYISGGNNSDIDLIAHSHIILFNENGTIVGYKSHTPKILANTPHGIDFDGWELYQSTEEFKDWPEELQGTLSAVVCIDKITCP